MIQTFALVSALILVSIFDVSAAQAADLNWTGRYRFEGVTVRNTNLRNGGNSKSYMLHHMILEPNIVAADGLNIFGRFDVLNNTNHLNSQAGQFLGSGPRVTAGSGTNAENSNVLSQTQKNDTILLTTLYLQWIADWRSVVVGRMPIHFGLGMTHNSGSQEFDHWIDTKDLLGVKMVFGNMFLMPMIGKVNEGDVEQEDDVNDYMVHFQYDNPETHLSMGVFYEARIGTHSGTVGSTTGGGNDAPTNIAGTGVVAEDWEGRQLNIFVSTKAETLGFGIEAGFQSGSTGIRDTAAGGDVSLQGFGIASELRWTPTGSKWSALLKAGLATGDDPSTTDKFEGYIFDRNYEVATLLFNHVLGQYDLFGTRLAGRGTGSGDIDTEAVSNVMYISPTFTYQLGENWLWDTRFTYAILSQDRFGGISVDKPVGWEIDIGTSYRPHSRFILGFDLGLMFPGAAFKGGTNNYPTDMAIGAITKAAVSF